MLDIHDDFLIKLCKLVPALVNGSSFILVCVVMSWYGLVSLSLTQTRLFNDQVEAAAATAPAAGSGPLALLIPWSWCCNGGASPLLVAAKGEVKFVAFGGSPN